MSKKQKSMQLIVGIVVLGIAIGCGGYFLARSGHHDSAKVASAEIVCEEGTIPTASQIDQALAKQGFKLAKMEQTADGKIMCQISGLKGECCAPGVETSLKNVPGIKLAKVSY